MCSCDLSLIVDTVSAKEKWNFGNLQYGGISDRSGNVPFFGGGDDGEGTLRYERGSDRGPLQNLLWNYAGDFVPDLGLAVQND
mmetsp:Transcript_5191/g.11283  ORF Transcript_5191/g.11283 Transcript_5191/m.11283 type:complete len:83 (+) Transcript_5191:172-420(+)